MLPLRVPLFFLTNSNTMADHDQLIAQLMSMADISKDKAQFYLEMAQWDLNVCKSRTPLRQPFPALT
jgi:hypothetical protein